MEKKSRYRNDINKCALGYQETKRVNQLFLDGASVDQIEKLVFEENPCKKGTVLKLEL